MVAAVSPLRNPVKWLKAHPFAADMLLALAISAGSIPALFVERTELVHDYREANAFAVILVLAGTMAVAWRRRWPMFVLVWTGVLTIVLEASNFPPSSGGVPVLIALYTVTTHCSRKVAVRAGVFTAL